MSDKSTENRFSVKEVNAEPYAGGDDDHYFTREAPPRVDHYRNVMSVHCRISRPTLEELFAGQTDQTYLTKSTETLKCSQTEGVIKLGWIQGVLIRCVLNIWGVMLFMRLSWVVGEAGIGLAFGVMLSATLVTTITSISMCAICTNGEVRGGGTYYMISRSLGPEFGGAIGIIFSLANAVAVAMYVIGFAEALQDVLKRNSIDVSAGSWFDIRIISAVTVCVLLAIAIIGMEWESKAQIILLVILLVAIVDFIIGSLIPPNENQKAKGFVGWNMTLMVENFWPEFREDNTFFSVFAVFFPSVTGILAGANISGDLKNPQGAIPKGSLLAILITSATYMLFALICGATVLRDADGIGLPANCTLGDCAYGLHNHFQVIELVSLFGPIVYGGVFAATLSSALASLVSAPKVFQALCDDKLFPYIGYFGKGYGPNREPRRAYVLAFAVALVSCLSGQLNLIAPIISNFFLCAYALINFSCFHASFAKSPGFRPSFRFYNKWVSLIGAAVSVLVMFTGRWPMALATYLVVGALYLYLMYRKPDVNWGSSRDAKSYISAISSVHKLNAIPFHVKNYRPQLLVLSAGTSDRPALVDFGYSIVKKVGFMICAHIVDVKLSQRSRDKLFSDGNTALRERHIKGFYALADDHNFASGVRSLVQSVGIGKLRPNVVMIGFKNDWLQCEYKEVVDYFAAIHHVFDNSLALAILRLRDGLDVSRLAGVAELIQESKKTSSTKSHSFSLPETPGMCATEGAAALMAANQFRWRQRTGHLDVWWLYDDGGLTLLLPHLLRKRKQWADTQLRVFALARNGGDGELERQQMKILLEKFRIDSEVIILCDAGRAPTDISKKRFEAVVQPWLTNEDSSGDGITDNEMTALRDKTNRHIRLHELVWEHSRHSELIVMTLPMPRKDSCSAALYMSWLEVLSADLPPFLFVRGDQSDVLTFYS
ncbi:unnamed protein product [Medioppia subpectinata]|uniref:Uncharacterized protein n=1 Tax=Medioppia subpectinata TaxID=1979941 RepID=A0A7R9KPI6_9ACAR|nr:unnamed protein product [Medioppia subpectinata]CAG2107439.1 unnamed protein product [Medioppia subpectinata]